MEKSTPQLQSDQSLPSTLPQLPKNTNSTTQTKNYIRRFSNSPTTNNINSSTNHINSSIHLNPSNNLNQTNTSHHPLEFKKQEQPTLTTNKKQSQTQQPQIHSNSPHVTSTKPIEFPSYSSVLDIRMPINERPSSFTHSRSIRNLSHSSESGIRRKTDSNHPFQKLNHQSTYLSDRHSIQSNRQLALDRHKKSSPQPASYQNHPLNLILCWYPKHTPNKKQSLSFPLTRRENVSEPGQTSELPSSLDRLTYQSKRKIYLPIQTIISAGLLIAIPGLFIYSTASNLIERERVVGIVILVIFSYIWLISLSSMIKTITSDPGILPRELDPNPEMQWKPTNVEEVDDEGNPINLKPTTLSPTIKPINNQQEKPTELEVGEWKLLPRWIKVETFKTKSSNPRIHLNKDKLDQSLGFNSDHRLGWIQSKWCTTCETYRPPRSSHCRTCDCCIDGIDHHCSYLNNCIGARNYRSFFIFLLASSIDLIIMITCTIWKLFILKLSSDDVNNKSSSILDSLKSHPIDIVVISFSILIFIPIFALAGYHIFLTCNGLTTIEYIKSQTTKKVIKENAKLVDEFYNNNNTGQINGEEEEANNKNLISRIFNKIICNAGQRQSNLRISNTNKSTGNGHGDVQSQRSNNFVIGRLCRPDVEAFLDWDSLV